MITSGNYVDRIIQNLSILKHEIEIKSRLGLNDINKPCEDLIKEILNRVYDLKLVNLTKENISFPGIDLGDSESGVAYQITSTRKKDKIEKTLEQCIHHQLYLTYNEIRVFLLNDKKESYKLKIKTLPYFVFDPSIHIIDFDSLFKEIHSLDVIMKEELCLFIERELPYAISPPTNGHELRPNDRTKIEEKHQALWYSIGNGS